MLTEVKVGLRVVTYWRQKMGDVCEVIMDEVDAIGIKWKGRNIVTVYRRRKVEGANRRYVACVKIVIVVLLRSDGILLRDWNPHHRKWSVKAKRDEG